MGSTVLGQTLAVLDALVPGIGGGPGPGGGGGTPRPSNPAVAMDFWFEFDDHFAFNPPSEVAAILGQPGLMDVPVGFQNSAAGVDLLRLRVRTR